MGLCNSRSGEAQGFSGLSVRGWGWLAQEPEFLVSSLCQPHCWPVVQHMAPLLGMWLVELPWLVLKDSFLERVRLKMCSFQHFIMKILNMCSLKDSTMNT